MCLEKCLFQRQFLMFSTGTLLWGFVLNQPQEHLWGHALMSGSFSYIVHAKSVLWGWGQGYLQATWVPPNQPAKLCLYKSHFVHFWALWCSKRFGTFSSNKGCSIQRHSGNILRLAWMLVWKARAQSHALYGALRGSPITSWWCWCLKPLIF